MKILVVDDHPLIVEALRHVLTALDPGITALATQDAESALEAAGANSDIALILLDLSLPDTDGFDLLRELRGRHPDIPVVVLSASSDRATIVRTLDEGAMGFIPKTSSNTLLVSALRLVLSGGVYLPPQIRAPQATAHSVRTQDDANPASYSDIGLTERQAQVLTLLVQGKPNKLICRELNLAEGTVKIHITAILKALKVANRTQAVIEVSRLGLRLDGLSRRTGAITGTPK